MTKRYKKKEIKKGNKLKLKKLVILIIIILITIFIIDIIKKEKVTENVKNEIVECDVSKYTKLNANILKIYEVKEELKNILGDEIKDIPLTKVVYNLETIDEGTMELEYYNEEKLILYKIKIDVGTKKIEKIDKYTGKEKDFNIRTTELVDNCDEDIQKDYNEEKSKDEQGNKNIYIIVTETDISISQKNVN